MVFLATCEVNNAKYDSATSKDEVVEQVDKKICVCFQKN